MVVIASLNMMGWFPLVSSRPNPTSTMVKSKKSKNRVREKMRRSERKKEREYLGENVVIVHELS